MNQSVINFCRLRNLQILNGLALVMIGGCGSISRDSNHASAHVSQVVADTFDNPDTLRRDWIADIPGRRGAAAMGDDGGMRLTLTDEGKVAVRRQIDVPSFAGNRVRISAKVRTDDPRAAARITIALGARGFQRGAAATTRSVTSKAWSKVDAVLDVDHTSSRCEIALELSGRGSAWFDDVIVESLGPAPAVASIALSSRQLENLEVLARVAALVRYRHPSDQAAAVDWDSFLPQAVQRVLGARSRDELIARLREVFSPIAPTVEILARPQALASEPPRGGGTTLARWRHVGFGTDKPYASWREGLDPDVASLVMTVPLALPGLARCKKARIEGRAHRIGASGDVVIHAQADRAGRAVQRFEQKLTGGASDISINAELPADVYRVRLGLSIEGTAGVGIEALRLACEGGEVEQVELRSAVWEKAGFYHLYQSAMGSCGANQCLKVQRRPLDSAFVPSRDMLDAEIGDHVWIHMPLALWIVDGRSAPIGQPIPSYAACGPTDLATRLAAIISAWGTLDLFYPYFKDQHIRWQETLRGALTSAGAARSIPELDRALSELLAKLHDDHARPAHGRLPIDGILPVAVRRFDDKLLVVGTVDEYAGSVPVGAEIIAIDGVPAQQAYADMARRVSSATPAWSEAGTALRLMLGPQGTFATIRVRTDGRERDLVLPRLSRELYGSVVREPRPMSGSEVAPGIYYVDLEALKAERWEPLLPSLIKARGIILDMRGYPGTAVFTMLAHFIDKPIRSPDWRVPVLESGDYLHASWEIRPLAPRLRAPVAVMMDGRAASAAETFLQIVHDSHLARLIGEPSGGTNGNIAEAPLPGGFSMRFTAMFVPLADGSALQGRGIVPDDVIHPTPEGVRTRRDEILEAAISFFDKKSN